jgi:carbonic anhydrase
MCEQHQNSLHCDRLRRRSFLKIAGSATAAGIFGVDLVSEAAKADALTKAQRDKMSPTDIIDIMKKGNERRTAITSMNRKRAPRANTLPLHCSVVSIRVRRPK